MKKLFRISYTNCILTIIAVALIGILFKDVVTTPTHASNHWASYNHTHSAYDVYGIENHTHPKKSHTHNVYDILGLNVHFH